MLAAEGSLRSWTIVLGAPAVVLLAAGLVLRRPSAIPAAIFLLGAAYATRLLAEEETLHEGAPIVAAALFGLAELAYWSLELRDGVADEAGAHLRRIGLLAGLTLGVLALGVALLALVDVLQTEGIAVEALGVAAAVAALALLAVSSRPTS
ncbi:MAG: hypothetical protein H0V45_13850 [Actinobacteria bacterium]|nr:hypothetical protein [Actinomycetota bacterium]